MIIEIEGSNVDKMLCFDRSYWSCEFFVVLDWISTSILSLRAPWLWCENSGWMVPLTFLGYLNLVLLRFVSLQTLSYSWPPCVWLCWSSSLELLTIEEVPWLKKTLVTTLSIASMPSVEAGVEVLGWSWQSFCFSDPFGLFGLSFFDIFILNFTLPLNYWENLI